MKIRFLGGAGEVTGSAHLLVTRSSRVLRDCGLFQGRRSEAQEKNRSIFKRSGGIDNVVISHAHIDHCGNVPTIVKEGFRGKVFATPATADLLPIMWADSAHIQEADARFLKKRGVRIPGHLEPPLYETKDAEEAASRVRKHGYGEPLEVAEDVSMTFHEAGHILGSALNVATVRENGGSKRIGFAFDLGRRHMPILKDPAELENLDVLVIESTYGARVHEALEDLETRLAEILSRTFARGGKVIIPAFALGRTQELLYSLSSLYDSGRVPMAPVFVDSPLATKVSKVFRTHTELYDEEAAKVGSGFLSDSFMNYTVTKEESQELNERRGPCLVISASGMCESGRIRHHLIHSIEDPRNTILFVGFLAQNTLGRKILEGAKTVRILDGEFEVKAEVKKLNALSAHADRNDLLAFIGACRGLSKLVLVHGEATQLQSLAEAAREVTKAEIHVPGMGDEIEL